MKNTALAFLSIFLTSLVCTGQNGYTPRDTSYSIHSTWQKVKKNHPVVRPVWPDLPKGVKAKNNLVYARLDSGQELHLDVFHPKKKKKKGRPAVLMIHGGGWTTGSKENLIPMAQQLAKAGYVTATVISGEDTIETKGEELLELLIKVASGERLGQSVFSPISMPLEEIAGTMSIIF